MLIFSSFVQKRRGERGKGREEGKGEGRQERERVSSYR